MSSLCAAAGLPGVRQQGRSLGPFSRIINSSLCPAWPTEQPTLPQGPQGPFPLPLHPSLRQGLPLPCAATGSSGQYLMCCHHSNLLVQPRLRLLGGVGN